MINKYILLALSTLCLASCGTIEFGTEQNYRNELQVYVGNNIDKVVGDLGHADNLSEAPNGNRLFVYSSFHTSTSPVNCSKDVQGNETCTGGNSSEHWCKTYFEVSPKNVVVAFTYKGNDCSACTSKDTLLCF